MIFLIITSPVWFPWKVLFVRKESKKFRNVSTPKKVFRILRSPITKPLKFMVFLVIIGIEIIVVYKVRYSPVTYTITRASVHNYYLKGENKKMMGLTNVNAASVELYYDELKEAFSYIDSWDLDSKNKMYVVLDADITKIGFKYMDRRSIEHVLNRFNTDETFREDVKYIAKNVNKIISRAVKEFPEAVPYRDFDFILIPVSKAVSTGVDYRAILDIFGSSARQVLNDPRFETNDNYEADDEMIEMIDASIDMVVRFSKGASIREAYDFINKNYQSNNSTTTTNAVITAN